MTKSTLIIVPLIILFNRCATEDGKTTKNIYDTIKTTNGYSIVLDDKRNLREIRKINKKDAFNIVFYDNEIFLTTNNNNNLKEYSLHNTCGLYKIKHKVKELNTINEFQTVYIDSTAPNFMIKESSDFVSILGLKDTISLNEKLIIKINSYNSTFPLFKMYIVPSSKHLTLNYNNPLKIKSFLYAEGTTDTIIFKNRGVYFYQGFIENYIMLEDSRKASVDNYFRKRIIVK